MMVGMRAPNSSFAGLTPPGKNLKTTQQLSLNKFGEFPVNFGTHSAYLFFCPQVIIKR